MGAFIIVWKLIIFSSLYEVDSVNEREFVYSSFVRNIMLGVGEVREALKERII